MSALKEAALASTSWPEVILLDIEMPQLDGWGFLDEYARLPQSYTQSCLLYLLSSSISPLDVNKSQLYPLVKSYLTKPLTLVSLKQIIQDFEALQE